MEPTHVKSQELSAYLTPLSDCDAVAAAARQTAIVQMRQTVDARIKEWLENPSRCYGRGWNEDGPIASPGAPMPMAPPSGGATANSNAAPEASSVSSTNNQVAGVDEADFIKNDHRYIYVLAHSKLKIIDAWPASSAHIVAEVDIEGEPRKLFVDGDRAFVYTAIRSSSGGSFAGGSGMVAPWPGDVGASSECTYGYDCEFTGDGSATKAIVLDIKDRANPKRVRQMLSSGSLIAARKIGHAVHTVVSNPPIAFSGLSYWPSFIDQCSSDRSQHTLALVKMAVDNLKKENEAIINKTDVLAALPSLTVSEIGTSTSREILKACSGFLGASISDGSTFTTVFSVDMVSDSAVTPRTIVTKPGAVYASGEALYISVNHKRNDAYGWFDQVKEDAVSTVHKFRVGDDPSKTAYIASGIVPGQVLNQFSMDEYESHLRIATTVGRVPDPKAHSVLSILGGKGERLDVVGQINNIAPDEDIRSVRFDGDKAYVVTFKKTDPLFVFELGDPRNPKLLAELKIPGFSTYMHLMDPTHLLTIGYDANDQGDFAWFAGVMLQIFDVSDPRHPKLTAKEVIGTRGSSSEALTNHLAFNYFAPRNLLALPMTICEGGSGGGFGEQMTFSGLIVFDVTAAAGFRQRGRVAHPPLATRSYNDAGCSNWWTNASSVVQRSIIMDDFIYSVSSEAIKVDSLNALGTQVAEVKL